MQQLRKEEISIYYWLQDLVPDSVNVEDGFPQTDLVLPTVSITELDIEATPFEMGGCELDTRLWRIDVFAENKAQRNNLAYDIYSELECGIPVYDYDEGFPPNTSPSQIGILEVQKRKLKPVHVFDELVDKFYWRSRITFFTYFE
jgi:hypothetical protein